MSEYQPDYIVPLGCFILEERAARGWRHQELAERAGMSTVDLANIVIGQMLLTTEYAAKLSRAFDGTSPEYWTSLAKQAGQWAET